MQRVEPNAVASLRAIARSWAIGYSAVASAASVLALIGIALLLAACQTVPVDKPCGVIRDNLATVKATTPGGQQRLDVHYERGRAAKCW